jgi:hypothetical protein
MDESLPFLAQGAVRLTYPRRFAPHLNVSADQNGIGRRLNRRPQLGRLGKTGMGRPTWCRSRLSALGHFVEGMPFEEVEIGARKRRENQDRALTTNSGRFNVARARLAPAMISTPGHWASRRRQRGALPAWSLRIVIGAQCFLARSRGIAYFRATDLFGRADFLLPTLLGGLRASLTVFPAWNRTALLAGILILSPVCGFRPSRAGRAATLDRLSG